MLVVKTAGPDWFVEQRALVNAGVIRNRVVYWVFVYDPRAAGVGVFPVGLVDGELKQLSGRVVQSEA